MINKKPPMIEVWIHNYRGEDPYKSLMHDVPRRGDIIHDAPNDLLVTQVEWFEMCSFRWVARIYTQKVCDD